MEIILDERDKKIIERVNEDAKNNQDEFIGYVNETDRTYSIEFTVNDLGKANNFIRHLITSNPDIREHISDALGIDVKCLNYVTKTEIIKELKTQINEFLESKL